MPFYPQLNPNLRRFIGEQKVFFTATAAREGRINVSPKGLDTLRVVDDRTVMYLDLTGSGNETAAHIEADGRLTLMFCSFTSDPLILRLYGRGDAVHRRDARFAELLRQFEDLPGARQIIVLHIESVQASCGQAVPVFELVGERRTLVDRCAALGPQALQRQWREHNQTSIDGLPTRLLSDDAPPAPDPAASRASIEQPAGDPPGQDGQQDEARHRDDGARDHP